MSKAFEWQHISNGESQLGPFVIPTHSLGFREFVAMCFLFHFFRFVYKYTFYGTIVLGFEGH